MPKRLLTWSRTEPARTVVFVVGFLTTLMQLSVLTPWVSENPWLQVPNVLLVTGICGWAVWASAVVNIKHMSRATFALFLVWFWSGLTRLVFSPNPDQLLWAPFLILSAALGVCYINLSHQRRKEVGNGMDN